jgi:hypothetical protein
LKKGKVFNEDTLKMKLDRRKRKYGASHTSGDDVDDEDIKLGNPESSADTAQVHFSNQ